MRPESFFENGASLPSPAARYSGLSAGVPGTVRGWTLALRRFGSRPLAELLRPAVRVARQGFVVDQTFVDQTTPNIPWFDDLPATAALYLDPDGTPRDLGAVVRNPDLARTLARIGRLGAAGFYRGADRARDRGGGPGAADGADADQTWRPGLMTEADLGYARWSGGRRAWPTAATTSSRWARRPRAARPSARPEHPRAGAGLPGALRARAAALLPEASRYAFADRGAYLGDPDFSDVQVATPLSDAFAATRRAAIGTTAADATVPAAASARRPAATAAVSRPTSRRRT